MMSNLVNSNGAATPSSSSEADKENGSVSARLSKGLASKPRISAPPAAQLSPSEPPAEKESQGVMWQDSLADQVPRTRRLRKPTPPLGTPTPAPTPAAARQTPSPSLERTIPPTTATPSPSIATSHTNSPGLSTGSSSRRRVFCTTGLTETAKTEALDWIVELGGETTEDAQLATHLLLAESLPRNEKLLSSAARGNWVLHPAYVSESKVAGRFLAEEEFEWGSEALERRGLASEGHDERTAHLMFWRRRVQLQGGARAFAGWRVLLAVPESKRRAFANILAAGDGGVVEWDEERRFEGLSHVLVAAPSPGWWSEAEGVAEAAEAGAAVFSTIHLSNTLSQLGQVQDEQRSWLPAFRAHIHQRRTS